MNDPAAPLSGGYKPHPGVQEQVFECHVRPRDFPGQSKHMTLRARSKEEATQKLLERGFLVVSVRLQEKAQENLSRMFAAGVQAFKQGSRGGGFSLFPHVTVREIIFFGVQLSTLLKAAVPLIRSLEIICRGVTNVYFQKVIRDILKTVSDGAPFSHALKRHPKVFPWIWVNLVEVGEATGKLPECLEEIGHYQESAERVKSKVTTAFFYPGILTVAVIGALTFLLLFVVPKFSEIFRVQKMELPFLTQVVVSISDVLRQQFPVVALLAILAAIGIAYTRKLPGFKLAYDTVILRAPVFGTILMQVSVVRFTRSLGTMMRSGVPILQALEISGRLVENRFIESGIKHVAQAVKGGQGLGVQLEARGIFPVFMTQLLSVGEESGQLEMFLDLLARYYEDQVDTFLVRLSTLIEPFLLIFMGAVIGTVVVSMFLPIIELSTRGGAA